MSRKLILALVAIHSAMKLRTTVLASLVTALLLVAPASAKNQDFVRMFKLPRSSLPTSRWRITGRARLSRARTDLWSTT